MFDAQAHATSDALVAMLASELEQEQQAKGNALTAYCDREIAELHAPFWRLGRNTMHLTFIAKAHLEGG